MFPILFLIDISLDARFEQNRHCWRLWQNTAKSLDDASNAHLNTRTSMAPGVKDDIRCSQESTPLERPAQQRYRFFPDIFFRRGQVDEIGRMNNDRIKPA